MTENEIGKIVVDCAVHLHQDLGPGLLESVYEVLLTHMLTEKGLSCERQIPVPIIYKGVKFEECFRADIIINKKVIIEIKSVECLNNAHKKQVLTYLKLVDMRLGFLLNFGEALMKNGIVRIVNGALE